MKNFLVIIGVLMAKLGFSQIGEEGTCKIYFENPTHIFKKQEETPIWLIDEVQNHFSDFTKLNIFWYKPSSKKKSTFCELKVQNIFQFQSNYLVLAELRSHRTYLTLALIYSNDHVLIDKFYLADCPSMRTQEPLSLLDFCNSSFRYNLDERERIKC